MGPISAIANAKIGGITIYAVLEYDAQGKAKNIGYVVYSNSSFMGSFATFRVALAFVMRQLALATKPGHFYFAVFDASFMARSHEELARKLKATEDRLGVLELEELARTREFLDGLYRDCADPLYSWNAHVSLPVSNGPRPREEGPIPGA